MTSLMNSFIFKKFASINQEKVEPDSKKRKLDLNTFVNCSKIRKVDQKVETVKKCLFGKADPADTERLLREQCEKDRLRLMDRFDIDIDAIENSIRSMGDENCSFVANAPGKSVTCDVRKKSNTSRKNVLKPRNSQKITDFYQVSKNTQLCTKKHSNTDMNIS